MRYLGEIFFKIKFKRKTAAVSGQHDNIQQDFSDNFWRKR
jgi:hypothetical protein